MIGLRTAKGVRYEVDASIDMPVIQAALPFVGALFVPDFKDPIKHMDEWRKKWGVSVPLAGDAGIAERVPTTGGMTGKGTLEG